MNDHKIRKTFGANVRKERLAAGWSQEELAAESGLHRTYIGAIERGERNVTLLKVIQIANAVGIEAGVLLKGTQK
ncbi:MAG: transcriptional regulator [Kangiella sp.]|nr:MAG: transcriptional regulator [bacterium]PHS15277.1 MAG: transcriptional regulator [Kangiella sp.]